MSASNSASLAARAHPRRGGPHRDGDFEGLRAGAFADFDRYCVERGITAEAAQAAFAAWLKHGWDGKIERAGGHG